MIELAEFDARPGCLQCGAALNPGGRFCHRCGAPVAGPVGVLSRVQAPEERRLVTALFVDLTGSTAIGEQLDAEQLREVMQEYYSAMREEIEAEGGTVSVFVGDAVMAVFGVPVAHEDDASRALRAGLHVHRRIERLNLSLEHLDDVRLGVRVGIHTGEILAGQHLTDADPRLGQLTGDALNVAARLESSAEPGQVVVSERTARAARGFRLRELGPLSLKGKAAPVMAFAVEGLADGPDAGPGVRAHGRGPLVGRADELNQLRATYDLSVAQSRPHAVTVVGEAGVGKSRLVEEFLEHAVSRHAAVLKGRCLPPGQSITYWPLAEVARQRCGVLIDDSPPVARERVIATCSEVLAGTPADAVRVASAMCFTIGIDSGESFGDMDARQVRQEIYDSWRWFFNALALRQPLVIEVEDLHNAGAALTELIDHLVDHGTGPVVWLCSARPGLEQRLPTWTAPRDSHRVMSLRPLSRTDSEALIHALLGDEELPEVLRQKMAARAEGNPFFLEEIVRHLVDEHRVVRVDGTWRLAGDADETAIPDTVQMALASRIDLLGADEKAVLQVAAVLGRDFWPGPIAHLLQKDVAEVEGALQRLETRDFVTITPGESVHGETDYAFRHMLTRDVAYQGLPRKNRTQAHIGIADWVAERFVQVRAEMAEILAYHYGTAYAVVRRDRREPADRVEMLRQKTYEATVQAAEATAARWAVDSAARLSREAVDVAAFPFEEARALEVLGRAQLAALDGNAAWDSWTRAVDLRLEHLPDDATGVARVCAQALEAATRWVGMVARPIDPVLADRYLGVGMKHAGADSVERVRLLTASAFWPFAFPGSSADARSRMRAVLSGEEACELALNRGRHDLASAALDGITNVHFGRGHYGPALEVTDRRLQLVSFLTDQSEVADLYTMAATSTYAIGRYNDAWEFASRGVEAAGDVTFFSLQALNWRGMANFRRGLWDQLRAGVATTAEILGPEWEAPPHVAATQVIALALVEEIQGRPDEADSLMQRCRWGLVESLGRPSVIKAPLVADLLVRRGRFAEARDVLGHPDWAARRENRGLLLESRCELLSAEGAWEEVDDLVAEARRFAREAGLEALRAYVDRLRGRAELASAGGRRGGATPGTGTVGLRATGSPLGARTDGGRPGGRADRGRAHPRRLPNPQPGHQDTCGPFLRPRAGEGAGFAREHQRVRTQHAGWVAFGRLAAVLLAVVVATLGAPRGAAAGSTATLEKAPSEVGWDGGPLSGSAPLQRGLACAPTACSDFMIHVLPPPHVDVALLIEVQAAAGNSMALAVFAPGCTRTAAPQCYQGIGPDDGLPRVRAAFPRPAAGEWLVRVACGRCAAATFHAHAQLLPLGGVLPPAGLSQARFDVHGLRPPTGQSVGEPGVATGPHGEVVVNTFGPTVWTSDRNGAAWSDPNSSLDPSGCPSQDADAAVGADGTLYAVNLCAGGLSSLFFSSTDGGRNWNHDRLGLPRLAGLDADRPWIATDPADAATVYVAYHSAGAVLASDYAIYVFKSTDHGGTFGPPVAVSAQDPAHLVDNTGGGNIIDRLLVDPSDHRRLYIVWVGTSAQSGQASAPGYDPGFTRILLGTSRDGGATWSTQQVLDDAAATVSHVRAVSSIDAVGNLYIAYSEKVAGTSDTHVMLTASADHGQRWTAPSRVDRGVTRSNVFPAMVATGPGALALSWEGSLSPDYSDDGDLWSVMFTRVENAQSTVPDFSDATPLAFNHAGAICMVGLVGCERVNQRNSLFDFNGIAATPDGRAILAWTDDLGPDPRIVAARELEIPGRPAVGASAGAPDTSPGLPNTAASAPAGSGLLVGVVLGLGMALAGKRRARCTQKYAEPARDPADTRD